MYQPTKARKTHSISQNVNGSPHHNECINKTEEALQRLAIIIKLIKSKFNKHNITTTTQTKQSSIQRDNARSIQSNGSGCRAGAPPKLQLRPKVVLHQTLRCPLDRARE